LFFI
jgi:hypothetical protein